MSLPPSLPLILEVWSANRKLSGLVLVFRDLRSNLHLSSFHHQKLLSSFSPTAPRSSRECFFGTNEIGMAGNHCRLSDYPLLLGSGLGRIKPMLPARSPRPHQTFSGARSGTGTAVHRACSIRHRWGPTRRASVGLSSAKSWSPTDLFCARGPSLFVEPARNVSEIRLLTWCSLNSLQP